MAGEIYANTDGAVCLADGGTPRVITVKAKVDISGGYWVVGSSAAGAVGSGTETYVSTDIDGLTVDKQLGSGVIGIALQDIPSGTLGPVAMRGVYLMPALSGLIVGSISSGWPVCAGSGGTVLPYMSGTLFIEAAGMQHSHQVGRALTAGGITGEFVAVSLNL